MSNCCVTRLGAEPATGEADVTIPTYKSKTCFLQACEKAQRSKQPIGTLQVEGNEDDIGLRSTVDNRWRCFVRTCHWNPEAQLRALKRFIHGESWWESKELWNSPPRKASECRFLIANLNLFFKICSSSSAISVTAICTADLQQLGIIRDSAFTILSLLGWC